MKPAPSSPKVSLNPTLRSPSRMSLGAFSQHQLCKVETYLSASAMSLVKRWCKSRTKWFGNDALMRSARSVGGPSSLYNPSSCISHGEEVSKSRSDGLTAYDSRYTFFRRHDVSRSSLNHCHIQGALGMSLTVIFHIPIP